MRKYLLLLTLLISTQANAWVTSISNLQVTGGTNWTWDVTTDCGDSRGDVTFHYGFTSGAEDNSVPLSLGSGTSFEGFGISISGNPGSVVYYYVSSVFDSCPDSAEASFILPTESNPSLTGLTPLSMVNTSGTLISFTAQSTRILNGLALYVKKNGNPSLGNLRAYIFNDLNGAPNCSSIFQQYAFPHTNITNSFQFVSGTVTFGSGGVMTAGNVYWISVYDTQNFGSKYFILGLNSGSSFASAGTIPSNLCNLGSLLANQVIFNLGGVPATPTPTISTTRTSTGTDTPGATATITKSHTNSPTITVTTTPTRSITRTSTPTLTATARFTLTNTPGITPATATPSQSITKTHTPQSSVTSTWTSTLTRTGTFSYSPTITPSNTPVYSQTFSPTRTPTFTSSPTNTSSQTQTFTDTPIFTVTYTRTVTPTGTPTVTPTSTSFLTPTSSPTRSQTFTYSPTVTGTQTPSITVTPRDSVTSTKTITPTTTSTFTYSPTASPSNSPVYSATATPTRTLTYTFSPTVTPTVTTSFTNTPRFTYSQTTVITPTFTTVITSTRTVTAKFTSTGTFTATRTPSFSPSPTITATVTSTPSLTRTRTSSFTLTYTYTKSITPTYTISITWSPTYTMSPTKTASPTPTGTSSVTQSFTATPATGQAAAEWESTDGLVYDLLNQDTSTLYVSGNYTQIGSIVNTDLGVMNSRTGIASGAWLPMIDNGAVYSVGIYGNTLYAVGNFSSVNGGVARSGAAAFDKYTGVVTPWNPAFNGFPLCLTISSGVIYIGGTFTTANSGVSRHGLAAVDTVTGTLTTWDPQLQIGDYVEAIALASSNIYVGGSITSANAGATTRHDAAAFTASGAVTSWNPAPNGLVQALCVNSRGTMYMGGSFSAIGASARLRMAEVDLTYGLPTSWNPGVGSGSGADYVDSIFEYAGAVYVGGSFSVVKYGTVGSSNMAAFNFPAGNAYAWFPNPNNLVRVVDGANALILVGGDFSAAGGLSKQGLAAIVPVTTAMATPNLTPTFTSTITRTRTVTPTFTQTMTFTQTKTFTASPTRTVTPTPTPTTP